MSKAPATDGVSRRRHSRGGRLSADAGVGTVGEEQHALVPGTTGFLEDTPMAPLSSGAVGLPSQQGPASYSESMAEPAGGSDGLWEP